MENEDKASVTFSVTKDGVITIGLAEPKDKDDTMASNLGVLLAEIFTGLLTDDVFKSFDVIKQKDPSISNFIDTVVYTAKATIDDQIENIGSDDDDELMVPPESFIKIGNNNG
jgi:hypothetical protein